LHQRQQLPTPRQQLADPAGYSSALNFERLSGERSCLHLPLRHAQFLEQHFSNYIYFAEVPGPLLAYSLNAGILNTAPASQSPFPYSGEGSPSISANGTSNGILWAVTWANGPPGQNKGTLRAFDATNLQTQFYASNLAAGNRDALSDVPEFYYSHHCQWKSLRRDREPITRVWIASFLDRHCGK